MVSCKVCEKEFENDRQLHGHLKAHGLRMVEYYQKHSPRHDKHDGKIIKFKNKEQYLTTEFNTRTNLRMWLKSISENEAKEYCKDVLIKRKEKRDLIYAPSQVELRTVISPPMQHYNELFGDYYRLCASLGFKNKYGRFSDIVSGYEYNKPEYKIFVDTRERIPLKFKRDIEVRKLDFGDYAFSSKAATCNCYIERKMLSDFIGTMSGGYERFINEIERAKDADAYLVILVEDSLNHAMSFPYLPHISKKIKATPEFIFHRVRDIIQKYPHTQFLFVNGRVEASRVIERIFTCGCTYKDIDLQYAYETKVL